MPWPLSIGVHAWFVISDGETTDRLEVWAPIWVKGDNTVIKNAMAPKEGFRRFYFERPTKPLFMHPIHEIFSIDGEVDSLAFKLYKVVENSSSHYPYRRKYRMIPGPNSNTYVAWVLQQVPEIDFELPWRAFGRNFHLP